MESDAIIDCDLLEASKENIQPLATGRRVTALSAVLSTPHAQRDAQHQAVKARLRQSVIVALANDEEGADEEGEALEAYTNFVNWTLEAYPQGHSADSGLLELLEEATRVLLNQQRSEGRWKWRNELAYLKLWILYAGYVEKPWIVYAFLVANEVGTEWGVLYEEYAGVLERSGRRTQADEIYILGISRHAQPLERLKNKHKEFQKRMMSSASTSSSASPSPATTTTKRTVLGTTRRTPSTTPTSTNITTQTPAQNARLQIYVDPSPTSASSLTPQTTDQTQEKTPYPDLGTRKTRIKENVPEVKKVGGSTMKLGGKRVVSAGGSGSAGGAGGSKIVVFRDEDVGAGMEGSGSKIGVFRDEVGSLEGAGTGKAKKPPARAGDGDVGPTFASKTNAVALVGFTPFRDEPTTPSSPLSAPSSTSSIPTSTSISSTNISVNVPETVMKPKTSLTALSISMGIGGIATGKGTATGVQTSEAEALKKDPLKNYVGLGLSVDFGDE